MYSRNVVSEPRIIRSMVSQLSYQVQGQKGEVGLELDSSLLHGAVEKCNPTRNFLIGWRISSSKSLAAPLEL